MSAELDNWGRYVLRLLANIPSTYIEFYGNGYPRVLSKDGMVDMPLSANALRTFEENGWIEPDTHGERYVISDRGREKANE